MTQLADALNLGDSSSFFRVCNSTSLFHAKRGSRTKIIVRDACINIVLILMFTQSSKNTLLNILNNSETNKYFEYHHILTVHRVLTLIKYSFPKKRSYNLYRSIEIRFLGIIRRKSRRILLTNSKLMVVTVCTQARGEFLGRRENEVRVVIMIRNVRSESFITGDPTWLIWCGYRFRGGRWIGI